MTVTGTTHPPATKFGPDPWCLRVAGVDPAACGREETWFALSNGWVGVRGSYEQGAPIHEPGTLVNRFHEIWPIVYPEAGFGFATTGQTIVYVPDATGLRVTVDGEVLGLREADVERLLDLRRGVLLTTARWAEAEVRWTRLVSLTARSLVAAQVEVTALRPLHLTIDSTWRNRQDTDFLTGPGTEFDPRRAPSFARQVLAEEKLERTPDRLAFEVSYRTEGSAMELTCRCSHSPDPNFATSSDGTDTRFTAGLEEGQTVAVEKVSSYELGGTPVTLPAYTELLAAQARHLEQFWSRFAVTIEGDPSVQQAVNWNVFQLHAASAQVDRAGLPAKGLTGQTYEGHYFWDMDVFMLPFVIHTDPAAAARILRFRHSMLAAARRRARELNLTGALFPWRTINGEEASAYFPAGTAQYHINAAVIHGLATYLDATGDEELLWEVGLEMAVETARMWCDLGFYDDEGTFHLHMVTGPDEYSALVDDNAYTNLMARASLRRTVDWVERLAARDLDRFHALTSPWELAEGEVAGWQQAAAAMHIPYDERRGITPQDARFLSREPWDWSLPPDRYPLLLNFHPLVIYRHQVLKQADVVMAIFNLPDDFSPELAAANFAYYDPITTGDSSLSPPVQAAVAAMIGESEKALRYVYRAAFTDLAGLADNVEAGVHLAAAGGVWLALVRGFLGLRLHEDRVSLSPILPPQWRRLSLGVLIRGSLLRVTASSDEVTVVVEDGLPLQLTIWGESLTVDSTPTTVLLVGGAPRV